jgi:hypothetical protein
MFNSIDFIIESAVESPAEVSSPSPHKLFDVELANGKVPVFFIKCPLTDPNSFRDFVCYLYSSGQMNRASARLVSALRNARKAHEAQLQLLEQAVTEAEETISPQEAEVLKETNKIEKSLQFLRYKLSSCENKLGEDPKADEHLSKVNY